jgi:hypothetical protein
MDALIPLTHGTVVASCGLNEADLDLLAAHVEDIGQAYADQIAEEFDEGLSEPVRGYVESLFTGSYDPSDRELPNLSPAGYVKLHELVVAAIIKAHRRNETKLYQTLMAYLRVAHADMALVAEPGRATRPRIVKSA